MLSTAEETEAAQWTSTGRKRIKERFRATLAGLLELEVLRVKHKVMVETVLEKTPILDSVSTPIQQGRHLYWVDEDSYRLKLKRSFSEEALHEVGTSRGLRSSSSYSSEDLLQHQYRMERCWHQELESRSSSGFCESDCGDVFTHSTSEDTVSSLSISLASLKYSPEESEETLKRRPILMEDHKELQSHFSEEAIPEDGFRSVADLYPDSHWPDVSDVLQPKVVLQANYRSDLPGHQGTEVYRYPSPLHAVALQSPLYASHNWGKKHFSGSSRGLLRPFVVSERSRCLEKSTYLSYDLLRKHSERHEEVILKRARVQCHNSGDGGMMPSRPKRGMHRTSSVHKSKSFFYQSNYLQRNREAKQVMRSYLNI